MERKIFTRTPSPPPQNETPATNALTETEQLMFQALKQLQEIYDAPCKTKADKITIERATFAKIATTFQQVYEQIKTKASTSTPTPAPENVSIFDTLQQIKVSITNLEAMQTTRNVPITDAPAKTYADAIKPPTQQLNYTNIRNNNESRHKEFSQLSP